ncbi:MAG: hypothetical protein ACRDY7_14975 [Acidimicrobiia bacterium]
MTIRRIAALLGTGIIASSLFAGAGIAGAGTLARGPGEGDSPEEEETDEATQQEPCPQDLWTIPLEVEGLACILLIPKDEGAGSEDAPGGGAGQGAQP